jgi:predicted regulator of Ras-like GTPase activity (Roadblock/LC7/MglB family)
VFDLLFEEIARKNPEIHLIGIWGKDGLELEKRCLNRAEMNAELLGAEIADVVQRIDQLQLAPGRFSLEYVTGRQKVLVFSLTNGYFLLVVAGPELISGRLAFYLSLNRERLASLL